MFYLKNLSQFACLALVLYLNRIAVLKTLDFVGLTCDDGIASRPDGFVRYIHTVDQYENTSIFSATHFIFCRLRHGD